MINLDKKADLEPILLTISTYNAETKELISGLLKEAVTLGTRRKLQKIHKEAYKAYLELKENVTDTQKECGEDKEKLEKELLELLNEPVKLDAEPILLSSIENIPTSTNYDFEIIEKIAI